MPVRVNDDPNRRPIRFVVIVTVLAAIVATGAVILWQSLYPTGTP
jgi:hypothetical protein